MSNIHSPELSLRLGEHDYTFSALTLLDWESYATACQWRTYHQLRDLGSQQSDLDRAFDRCAKQTPSETDINEFSMTAGGMKELLYLSARHKHPQLTRNQFGNSFSLKDGATIQKITQFILQSSMPDQSDEPKN